MSLSVSPLGNENSTTASFKPAASSAGMANVAVTSLTVRLMPVPAMVPRYAALGATCEGGSGGALALGVGDRVNMLQFAIYSVISPEGCAAILWSDQSKTQEAAESLRFTAPDLKSFGLIDAILPEPVGGAHADPPTMALTLREQLEKDLEALSLLSADELIEARYEKFRRMGAFLEQD